MDKKAENTVYESKMLRIEHDSDTVLCSETLDKKEILKKLKKSDLLKEDKSELVELLYAGIYIKE